MWFLLVTGVAAVPGVAWAYKIGFYIATGVAMLAIALAIRVPASLGLAAEAKADPDDTGAARVDCG